MKSIRICMLSGAVALWFSVLPPAGALNLVLDYSHDAAGNNFFGTNATAKASLEAAAADLEDVIGTTLSAVTNDAPSGTSGSTTVTYDARYNYKHPETGASIDINDTTSVAGADEFRIFVGMRPLSGTTLGQGGPGGVGVGISASGFEAEVLAAGAAAEAAFNAEFGRGGPLYSTLSGSWTLGATSVPYDLEFGPTVGNLWFDIDTDNNGVNDLTEATDPADFWHYDHTTTTGLSGKRDFYSVAVHEIMHALGIGTIDNWDDLASGTDWSGAAVIAALGSGTGALHTDSSHIASGTMSTTISDGTGQEAVMDPSLTVGTRKETTTLDAAFLQDIGWTLTVIPEPSRAMLLVLGFGLVMVRRRRK